MSKHAAASRRAAPQTLSGFFREADSHQLLPQLVRMLRRVGADPLVVRCAEWAYDHRFSRPVESREFTAHLLDYLAGRSSQPGMTSLDFRCEFAQFIILDERTHAITLQVLKRMGVSGIDRLRPGQRRLFLTGVSMLLSNFSPESRSACAEVSR